MTINYTTLLGLAEPVTGTQSGTWGDDVNKGITEYVDIAVAGTQTISGSQTAVTLSITNGSSAGNNIAQVGSGSTGSAQYQIINCTGNPASLLTITAPASSKTYVVINATSTSQSVKIVGAGPTTGVTIASGDKALVAWNGSDFVRVGASAGGSNTQIQYNNGGNLAGSANLTFDGSNVQIGSAGALRFADTDSSNYVAFKSAGTVPSNVTWTLPSADGTSGQFLSTNGSGTLSFASVSSPAQAGGALIVNTTTATTSYTVPSGSNAFSVGPITVASGITVSVSSGQRWVVI